MRIISAMLVALLALTIVGCGPTEEQKKMVADLTTEVTTMVNDATSSLGNIDNMAGEITTAISGAQELSTKFPKEAATINDAVTKLTAAKDRLTGVKDNVSAWLQNYKTPDLATMKFDEVVTKLKTSKDELTTATTEIQGALGAAETALTEYKGIADGLMAKARPRGK
ncbi:MAG: hypothetical protein HUU41_18560 [Bryobacteraceae bacterium]|nr:hypothetical protein [Bryobacteraceae bacterium]